MTNAAAISDSTLVNLAAATYTRNDPFAVSFDGAIRAFTTPLPGGINSIDIEGTHSIPGWMLDFDAIDAEPIDEIAALFLKISGDKHPTIVHPQLGLLHAGFDAGAMSIMPKVALIAARGPTVIDGHSLGASVAARITAELVLDGTPPLKMGLFAPARAGGDKFVKVATSVPFCAYIFGNDPVPDVPFTVLPDFPYAQVPLTPIGAPRPSLLRFTCHHIQNYVSGVHQRAEGIQTVAPGTAAEQSKGLTQ